MAVQIHRKLNIWITFAAILLLAGQAPAQMQMPMCHPADSGDVVPPEQLPVPQHLSGIGNMHFPISANREAQVWFDQGINLNFDFWDYEAARAFEQAIRTDPNCAICYWGLYQSEGSHNSENRKYGRLALDQAVALKGHASAREKLYIAAAHAHEAALARAEASQEEEKDDQEIALLRRLVKKNPHDTTARIFLGQVLADGYDKTGQPRKGEQENRQLLQSVLAEQPNNSGANHLWIHAVEASPHPEDALHSAEILGSLAPASGHMVHMPGHIFYRLGDYARAQQAFDASTAADEAYMRAQHVAVDNDWNYVHNLMYSVANLLEAGRMNEAQQVSAKLTAARGHREDTLYPWSARDAVARLNPELPVALRTADWKRATQLIAEANIATSMPHMEFLAGSLSQFALGMQAVEAHKPDEAERHALLLDANLWRMSQEVSDEGAKAKNAAAQNTPMSPDPLVKPLVGTLSILSLELRASALASQQRIAEAKDLFAKAREQEQDLGYHEPPFSIRPVDETEAAALVAAGRWADAKAAYEKALTQRPKSGFPLYGIAVADEHADDMPQAAAAYRQFLAAWKTADPGLPQLEHAQQWLAQHGDQAGVARTVAAPQ